MLTKQESERLLCGESPVAARGGHRAREALLAASSGTRAVYHVSRHQATRHSIYGVSKSDWLFTMA
jgi:hypothetical protein